MDDRNKVGTYFRDGAGQDYAEQRYYGAGMGRFWSPAPAGRKAANPSNPTSWNRYAYVYGDPINLMDHNGKAPCGGADGERPCPAEEEDEGGPGICFGFIVPLENGDSSGIEYSCDQMPAGPSIKNTPSAPPPTCDQLEAQWIDDYLQNYKGQTGQGSPLYAGLGMAGTPGVDAGTYLVDLADSTGIDPAFILGIARAESSLGTAPRINGGIYNVYGNSDHFTHNLYTNYFGSTQDAFGTIAMYFKHGVAPNTTAMYSVYVNSHTGTVPTNLKYFQQTDSALFGNLSNVTYTCGSARTAQLDAALGIGQ